MAGTTELVKRKWSLFSYINAQGTRVYDAFRAFYEQINNIVTDLETLRAASLAGLNASALPGLAIGTVDAAEIKITNAFTVLCNGYPVTVAAQEVAFTATTHDIADPDANPREAYYLLCTDTQGNVSINKGADSAEDAAVAADIPAGETCFGRVKIQHDGTAIFDATTDLLSAAHLTVTYEDLVQLMAASSLVASALSTVEQGD
jgi:hypothetical protein